MADVKVSALTALTGANVDPAADVIPIVDTSVTTTKKILVSELFTSSTFVTPALGTPASGTLTNCSGYLNSSKVIYSARAMSAANGAVAITGVGFQPRSAIFMAATTTAGVMSWGMADSAKAGTGVYDNSNVTARLYGTMQAASNVVVAVESAGVSQSAVVTSWDADGVTLTWTKAGSPSENVLQVMILFFK